VNVKGTFLVTQGFIQALPSDTHASVVSLTTGASYTVIPGISAYSISKLAVLQLSAYVAAENPQITAVALHPGVVDTEMTIDAFKKFADDTPELVGGAAVWAASDKAKFMSGRYLNSNWDVEDLEARKDEIIEKELLKIDLKGQFGAEQFA
jgi:NAD(P)-dependent dehydrogenase (short-subunit alcohol dehydrogenase family)